MSRVSFTPAARLDVREIYDHIAEGNPARADAFVGELEARCNLLGSSPEMGRLRSELAPGLRSFPVGNYVIFYRPRARGVLIVRILHGARDITVLF